MAAETRLLWAGHAGLSIDGIPAPTVNEPLSRGLSREHDLESAVSLRRSGPRVGPLQAAHWCVHRTRQSSLPERSAFRLAEQPLYLLRFHALLKIDRATLGGSECHRWSGIQRLRDRRRRICQTCPGHCNENCDGTLHVSSRAVAAAMVLQRTLEAALC